MLPAVIAGSIFAGFFRTFSENPKIPLAIGGILMYNRGALLRRAVHPPVAKLDIAVDSDSKGRGFESLRAGQKRNNLCLPDKGCFFSTKSLAGFVKCTSCVKYAYGV